MFDFCVYNYGIHERSYDDMFKSTNFTYKVINFHMGFEHYTNLPEKTYMMLSHLVTYERCKAALKIDDDAVVCLKNFMLDSIDLKYVYAGIGIEKAAVDFPRSSKLWTPTLKHMSLHPELRRPYVEGAAYVVGYNVASHITSKSFKNMFNTRWEDANVGLHSYDYKERNIVMLSKNLLQLEKCKRLSHIAVYHKCTETMHC